MKKPRFKESQIFQVLKEADAGVPVPDVRIWRRLASPAVQSILDQA